MNVARGATIRDNAAQDWTRPQVEVIELSAGPAAAEQTMEARIARLESDVAHLRTDVADIKVDVRSLRDKMDAMGTKLSANDDALRSDIGATATRLDAKIDAKFDKLRDELVTTRNWAFALYVTLAAGVFATMARGFGWL
jgi:outer membrane murein-binding lipoprotein Lpp